MHGKKPTKRQAMFMQAMDKRMKIANWLVCKDTPDEMVVKHRESGKERSFKK